MNCPNCGTTNLETSSICVNCGRPLSGSGSYTPPPPPPPPVQTYTVPPPPPNSFTNPPRQPIGVTPIPIPNYLVYSIIATLCCCMPLGVVAIIFSAQVNSKLAAGDIAGAREASNKAKLFCWISAGLWVAIVVLGLLFNGAALLSEMGR